MATNPPPPPINFERDVLLSISEVAKLRRLRNSHTRPATTPTIRAWATDGIAGLKLPTRVQRIGPSETRLVTTEACVDWFDRELLKRRHPALADKLAPIK